MIQAVRDLHTHLKGQPWFASVGQGDGRIIVYVTRQPVGKERRALPGRFAGYDVSIAYAKRPEADS